VYVPGRIGVRWIRRGRRRASKSVTVNAADRECRAGRDGGARAALFVELSFADPDNDGPWSYRIDWGDGSSSTGSKLSQGTFTTGHTYTVFSRRARSA